MLLLIENLLSYIQPIHLIISLLIVLACVVTVSIILRFHIHKYSTKNMKIQSMQLVYYGGLGVFIFLALVFLALSL